MTAQRDVDQVEVDQAAAAAVALVKASYRVERAGRLSVWERNQRERAARRARGMARWAERTRR
jgi:hypothetical protein